VGWNRFRNITLPLLTPAIFFNVVTGLIGAFQEFTKFVIFAGGANATGGPDNSLLTTFWYVYLEGFDYQHMGLATAMAFGLFALILIFTLLNFIGQKRWVFYQEERQ
jgi:multiple sugar transport system permease protein